MTPFEKAARVYWNEPCRRLFIDDLTLHMKNGFVFSTPEFSLMGRAVRKDALESLIVDPSSVFERSQADCWHIYLFAGDLTKASTIMPWPLPWISIERKNELRFYPLAAMARLASLLSRHEVAQTA